MHSVDRLVTRGPESDWSIPFPSYQPIICNHNTWLEPFQAGPSLIYPLLHMTTKLTSPAPRLTLHREAWVNLWKCWPRHIGLVSQTQHWLHIPLRIKFRSFGCSLRATYDLYVLSVWHFFHSLPLHRLSSLSVHPCKVPECLHLLFVLPRTFFFQISLHFTPLLYS